MLSRAADLKSLAGAGCTCGGYPREFPADIGFLLLYCLNLLSDIQISSPVIGGAVFAVICSVICQSGSSMLYFEFIHLHIHVVVPSVLFLIAISGFLTSFFYGDVLFA